MTEDETQVTPEQGTAPEGEVPLQATEPSGGDPLDTIQDIDAVRAEAKKFRSIAQRKDKPQPVAPAPSQPVGSRETPGGVLTKEDLYRFNSNKARKMLRANPDMAAVEDDIVKTFVSRRGQDDAEDIFEDLKDAFTVVKSRTSPTQESPAASLQTSTVVKPSSSKPVESPGRKTQPLIPRKTNMRDWYPKQS